MKVFLNKVVAFVLIIVLLWFVGYNVVRFVKKPFQTEIVVEHTVVDSINVKGLTFRDEQVIKYDYKGVPRYLYQDASKVGENTAIMEVYPSKSDILNIEKIMHLKKEKQEYMKLSNIKFSSIVSTELLTKEIDKQIFDILSLCDSRNTVDTSNEKLELAVLLNKKDLYTGSKVDYSQKINKLENTIESLENNTKQPTDSITTEVSGYFVKYTDGYEDILNTSLVSNMTVEQFKEYISAPPQKLEQDAVGKIVENHNWYFSFLVSKQNMQKFQNALKVDVNFHLSSIDTVPADIVAITESSEDDTYLVTLKMNYVNDEIATLRSQAAEVEFRFYSGLRVSKDAIRFLNDQRGVYVVGTNSIKFVPINVVYEDKNYSVVTSVEDNKPLKIYDKVVVGGNVYDGKPI